MECVLHVFCNTVFTGEPELCERSPIARSGTVTQTRGAPIPRNCACDD